MDFSKSFDLVVKDHKADSNTTEYQYYELLQLIKDTFKKYPNSVRTDCVHGECKSCTAIVECNLYHQMQEISALSECNKR